MGYGYYIDCTFCIDGTVSMGDYVGVQHKVIDRVKKSVIGFYGDLKTWMYKRGKELEQLRVRLIVFRDYMADGPYAMQETDFFLLPQQIEDFEKCVNSICVGGGGDIPEDGLEALAYAMKSK